MLIDSAAYSPARLRERMTALGWIFPVGPGHKPRANERFAVEYLSALPNVGPRLTELIDAGAYPMRHALFGIELVPNALPAADFIKDAMVKDEVWVSVPLCLLLLNQHLPSRRRLRAIRPA